MDTSQECRSTPGSPMTYPDALEGKGELPMNQDAQPNQGGMKRSVAEILSTRANKPPPRRQTQIHNPQDLRDAVDSARQFDGITSPDSPDDPQPTFLPFSGNFILDSSFTLPDDNKPLLEKVQELDINQKADCASLAQQLVFLVEEVDGFAYVKQGTGSRLHGFQTGWYFHYVCDTSKSEFPNRGDCGSIYVSMSTERIYVYYTYRDAHEPTVVPQRSSQGVEENNPWQREEIETEIDIDECPTPKAKTPTLHRKPSSILRSVVPTIESSLREGSPSIDERESPLDADFNLLPKIHPTPVDISGSVHRNYMKLGALRDLVDSWLPEDDYEGEGGDKHTNPFLRLTFTFMIEWFESSMGHPEVQREIYKILDLESDADGEGANAPEGSDAGDDPLRKPGMSPRSPKPPKLSLEMPKNTRRSVRDLLKLGYATLSPIAEDQVKRPNEKRKSGDATFYFGERKKKSKKGV